MLNVCFSLSFLCNQASSDFGKKTNRLAGKETLKLWIRSSQKFRSSSRDSRRRLWGRITVAAAICCQSLRYVPYLLWFDFDEGKLMDGSSNLWEFRFVERESLAYECVPDLYSRANCCEIYFLLYEIGYWFKIEISEFFVMFIRFFWPSSRVFLHCLRVHQMQLRSWLLQVSFCFIHWLLHELLLLVK